MVRRRFFASQEAEAHDAYKGRVLSADVGDTAILSIYGPEWPDQAMRVIVNDGARVALGREREAIGDAEGQIIGSTVLNGQTIPVPRYSAILPTRDFDGDIEQACLTAGQRGQHRRDFASRRDHPAHDERGEGGTQPLGHNWGGRVMCGLHRPTSPAADNDQPGSDVPHAALRRLLLHRNDRARARTQC